MYRNTRNEKAFPILWCRGEKYVYSLQLNENKKVGRAVKSTTLPTDINITQTSQTVNTKFSLKEQQFQTIRQNNPPQADFIPAGDFISNAGFTCL